MPKPRPSSGTTPAASAAFPAPEWSWASQLTQPLLDLPRLERMLCAWATHPQGLGCARVALLVWNPQRGQLEGHLAWRDGELTSLSQAIAAARQAGPEGPEPERTRDLRLVSSAPESWSNELARVWGGQGSALLDEPLPQALVEILGGTCHGAITLARDHVPYAVMLAAWNEPSGPEARAAGLEALQRVARGALALEAAEESLKRRVRQTAALVEFARAGVSDLNLAEVLNLLSRLAASGTTARGAAVWLVRPGSGLRLESTFGPGGARERVARGLQPLAADVLEGTAPRVLDRVTDEPRLSPESAAQLSAAALFPLGVLGRRHGVLAVYDRASFHPGESPAFQRGDVEFLTALADQAALALEHAARLADLRASERRGRDAQQRLRRTERLAAVGESALRVTQEIRNPLASIAAFARRVHRELAPDDPHREYLEIVLRESDRLEHLVAEQLQVAASGDHRLGLESLNQIVQEALQQVGERLVRRRVRLLKKLSPDVPPLLLDAGRIRRVVTNIVEHALEAVSPGGRIRIESRRVQQYVLLDVAHDGAHPGGDLLGQLFVPFAGGRSGTGNLGLALAQQVVHEHGGEIRVRSEGEWSSVFSFTLPVPLNQDRRNAGRDRRSPRSDRRRRFPAA
jgi:signal transduction histidine kinase